jgi:hypothetical protein
MKQVRSLAISIAFPVVLLFLFSCNTGNEKKTTGTTVKADTALTSKAEPTNKPALLMIIRHRVADFNKWMPLYESHDSVRLSYGLHSYGVSRGVDDTNMVMVALKIDDIARAKEFAALPDLKTAMKKGGVLGTPDIRYYDRRELFMSTNDPSTRVMVSHKVKDWDAFKKVFDNDKQARTDAGLTDRSVGYESGNNKMVTIVAVVSDLKKARDFFASKQLKEKMEAAGVDGPPDIFFYNLIKKY